MRSWFLSAVGICLFATLAINVVHGADTKPFSYSFTKGETWQYKSVETQQVALNDTVLLDTVITTKLHFEVLEEDKKSSLINVRYEAIGVEAMRAGQKQAYDSETGEGNGKEIKTAVDDLVGRSITLRIAADGTLSDLKGLDAIAASPFGQIFAGFTSDEVFLRVMQKLFPPAGKLGDHLKADESWTTTDRTDFDSTTTLVIEVDHVVQEVTDNMASIKLVGSAELKSTQEDFDAGIESQAIAGEATWDADQNRMSSYHLESDISILRQSSNSRILLAVHHDTVTTLIPEN